MKYIDFEKIYREKEDPWGTSSLTPERFRLESTYALIKGKKYKNILDIGCGEGIFTQHLLKISGQVAGIDISPTAVKRARIRLGEKVTLIVGDAIHPALNSKFDLLCCLEMLYYLEKKDIYSQISGFYSLLEEGGELLISAKVTGGTYFTYGEFIDLLNKKFQIKAIRILKTKLYHGENMSIYKWAIKFTGMAPKYLSEHIAILAEK